MVVIEQYFIIVGTQRQFRKKYPTSKWIQSQFRYLGPRDTPSQKYFSGIIPWWNLFGYTLYVLKLFQMVSLWWYLYGEDGNRQGQFLRFLTPRFWKTVQTTNAIPMPPQSMGKTLWIQYISDIYLAWGVFYALLKMDQNSTFLKICRLWVSVKGKPKK